jgi:hypothetical protein
LTHAFLIFFLSAIDSFEKFKTKIPDASRDENTLPKDVSNKLSVVSPHAFYSSFSQGGGDQINYGTAIFNRYSRQV